MLIHLVDLAAARGGPRPAATTSTCCNHELARYSPELAGKPQIVVANKVDLPDGRERLASFQAAMAERGVPVFPISAATGEGVGPLLDAVAQVLTGGALPTLGRAARPRRRPRSGVALEWAAAAGPSAPREAVVAAPRRPMPRVPGRPQTLAASTTPARRGAATASVVDRGSGAARKMTSAGDLGSGTARKKTSAGDRGSGAARKKTSAGDRGSGAARKKTVTTRSPGAAARKKAHSPRGSGATARKTTALPGRSRR